MNRNIALSLCIACGCCAAAFADDITVDPHPFAATLSRAQVREELHQFRTSGVNPWADDYDQLARQHGTMARAQATADFLASRKMVSAFSSEDSGSSYLMQMAKVRRVPVTEFAGAAAAAPAQAE